jgi:hypothetical protein
MRDFIRMSTETGKTKLIFDLRGNGGGNAILGYDTFKQVFPQADFEPFGGTRYRAHEALDTVGRMTEEFALGKTYAQGNETAFSENFESTNQQDINLFTAAFNFQHQLGLDESEFESWMQLFGPEEINGDLFSRLLRYNFSDEISYTYPGFSVTGFLNNSKDGTAKQPFKAEDIVMVFLPSPGAISCFNMLNISVFSYTMACVHRLVRSSLSFSKIKAACALLQ